MFLFKGLVRESIMVICEFYESDFVCVCGGGRYWCLTLVWGSYYAVGVQVHMSSHSRTVESSGLLSKFHALISVQN